MSFKILLSLVCLSSSLSINAQLNKKVYRYGKGNELYSLVRSTSTTDIEVVSNKKFTDVQAYSPILHSPEYLFAAEDKQFGVINQDGDWVTSPQYDAAKSFSSSWLNNNFIFKKNNKWGITNYKNDILAPFQFENIEHYKEGILARKGPLIYAIDKTGKCKFGCNEDLVGNVSIDIAQAKMESFVKLADSVSSQNIQNIIQILDRLEGKEVKQLSLVEFSNYLKYLNQVNWCYYNIKENLSSKDQTYQVAHYNQSMFLLINFRFLSAIEGSMGIKLVILEYLNNCIEESTINTSDSYGDTVSAKDLESFNQLYIESLVDFAEYDLKYSGYNELGISQQKKVNLGEFVLNHHKLLKEVYADAFNSGKGTTQQRSKLFKIHDLLLNGDSFYSARYTTQEFLEATSMFFRLSEELKLETSKDNYINLVKLIEDLSYENVDIVSHIELVGWFSKLGQFDLIKKHHHHVLKTAFIKHESLISLLDVSTVNSDRLGCAIIANKLRIIAEARTDCYLWDKTKLAAEYGGLTSLAETAQKELKKCNRKQTYHSESKFNVHALFNVLPLLNRNREFNLSITGGDVLLEMNYKLINQKWDTGIDVESELGSKSVRLNYSGVRYLIGVYKLLMEDEDLRTYSGFRFRHQMRQYDPVNSLVFTSSGTNLGYSEFIPEMKTYDLLYGFVMLLPLNRLSIGLSAGIGGAYKSFKVNNPYYNNPDITIEHDLLNGRKPVRITPTFDLSFNIGFNLTKK